VRSKPARPLQQAKTAKDIESEKVTRDVKREMEGVLYTYDGLVGSMDRPLGQTCVVNVYKWFWPNERNRSTQINYACASFPKCP